MAEQRSHSDQRPSPEALLEAARESIGRLAYFQKDRDETGEE